MRKKNKLVCGWGINDVGYNVYKHEFVNGKKKIVWRCPYYSKWVEMIRRCFCTKTQTRHPTYRGCTIYENWKYLSNFIKWVDSQPNRDWQNCEPDKDLLIEGNKHYSPETVVFVNSVVNRFIEDCSKVRGSYMIGVCASGRKNKPYSAGCSNPFTVKQNKIGRYKTELEAHLAWQAKKHEYSCMLADLQTDERVAKILRERYAPDKDWTKA